MTEGGLRQNYHFGPGKIRDYLGRFHGTSLSAATVHRILQRHGMARLPANQKHGQHTKRWKRYEKQQPYDACNQATAIQFVDEVIRRLPFRILVVPERSAT